GDRVSKDQVLIRLNDTRAVAEQGVISSQYILAMASEARLRAERDGLPEIQYEPAFVERFKNDPRYISATGTQDLLFQTRREALEGEITILKENLNGAQQQLKGMEQVQANRKNQIGFIQRE